MKNKWLIALFSMYSLFGFSQNTSNEILNLDFENVKVNFPVGYDVFGQGNYDIISDSKILQNGKYAVLIQNSSANKEGESFKALAFTLPKNYKGNFIRLKGFIKTENVTNGYAGLWLRIDPEIGFDNMNDRGIVGTTDWKEYEIVLPLDPKNTKNIVIGALLVGDGKMWIDNLQVEIDDKKIDSDEIEVFVKELLPADKDKMFDKGSNITITDLSQESITNLELLGKVWGFLKYHHPEVAKGNYNWDYELFRFLPQYLNAKNNKKLDGLLVNWINNLGNIPECNNCKVVATDAVLKPEMAWIENSNLSTELKKSIQYIYQNAKVDENYYLKFALGVNNPEFLNENIYVDMNFPDDGFRLLALYRYWNMMQYFNPNRHLTDKDWNVVLKEYIPTFLNAKNRLDYELAFVQIIGDVKDTHANLWRGGVELYKLRGENYAPFRAEFVENKYVVTDYYNPEHAENTKLKIGDIITHINGKDVTTIIDSLRIYYPTSNEASFLRNVSIDLLRSTNSELELKYKSNNQVNNHTIPLFKRDDLNMYHGYKVDKDAKSYKILEGNIGYVSLANIKDDEIPLIKADFINTKGIIIDIRNYPNTFVPFQLGSYFVTEPTPFVKFTYGSMNNPGEFTFGDGPLIESDGNKYNGKLVILVNENSQSSSEYTAMAFKVVKDAKIIGSTTAGADGNVSRINLPGGLGTMISGIGVYYPDGKETQRVGIVPDIFIQPTIEGIKSGKDEVLLKAIEVINN